MRDLLLLHALPLLVDLLLPLLVGAVLMAFRRYAGIQIEGKHMATLQSALSNAAKLVLAGGSIEDAVGYVRKAAPDALAAFGIASRERIEELLRPHIAALPKAAG